MDAPILSILWQLTGQHLPPVEDTHRVAHLAKRAAMGTAARLVGPDAIPAALHGHAAERSRGDPHAHYLPIDSDGDGWIDRLLVHAPAGLCSVAVAALCACRWLYGQDNLAIGIEVAALGPQALEASGLAGPALCWRSITPWVRSDRFDKPGWGLRQRVTDDARCRGLPPPATVTLLAPAGPRFRRVADRRLPRPPTGPAGSDAVRIAAEIPGPGPDPLGRFLELSFTEPIAGPILLGWEAHFGFGLCRPMQVNP